MTADEAVETAESAGGKAQDAAGQSASAPSSGPGLKGVDDGSFDEQEADAYEGGRQRFRLPPSTFTSGRDQDIQIGSRYYFPPASAAAMAPGPVPLADIEAVRSRYAPVNDYDELRKGLSCRGLLVLAGSPRSGRKTTALHLLDTLAKAEDGLARIDAQAGLAGLDKESIEHGHGYLVALPDGVPLSRPQADRLSALCRDQESFCVAVVDHGSMHVQTLQAYVAHYRPPPPSAVLQVHIDAEIRSTDAPRLGDRLMTLANDEWLSAALGPDPLPADVAATAQRLVEQGRETPELIDLTPVAEFCSRLLEAKFEQWFAALRTTPLRGEGADRTLRLAAYRIALAVFDGLPWHVVGDTAEDLVHRLIALAAPLRKAGRPPVLDDETAFLGELRAERVDGAVRYTSRSVPAVLLQYRDHRIPATLLSHVWRRHHNLRAPLGAWLSRLGCDARRPVRIRAAQAAGLLCAVDFSYTFPTIVAPAAASVPRREDLLPSLPGGDPEDGEEESWAERRIFAAVALDQAATNALVRETVMDILRSWRRSQNTALRWSAAVALGYELGRGDIDRALDELRVIGTPQETADLQDGEDHDDKWELIWVAAQSLARLFAWGARDAVLYRLTEWLDPRGKRSLQLLAQQAVIILAGLRVSAVAEAAVLRPDTSEVDTGRPGRWPLLAAVIADDPQLSTPVADLLRATLRGPGRLFTEDAIGRWMRVACDDDTLLTELERFLPVVIADEADRARLLHLVRRLRRSWADPLPPDIADRLEAALNCRRY
jgi:hypothetical protein